MNRLSQNELMGTVAIQCALENTVGHRLSLAKMMLVLPLLFDRAVRSVLKRKNSVVLGSKDLLISNPVAFVTIRKRYEDLTITSLNAIVLAHEMGLVTLAENSLVLQRRMFNPGDTKIGKHALDILASGPNLGVILNEDVADLYQTFRIDL